MIFLVVLAVFVGAAMQRITGMGFALAVSPLLVILLGPFDGVLIVNICGAISGAIVFARVWREVEWRKYFLLVIPALLAIVPGSYLAATLPGPALEISIGVLLIIALSVSLAVARTTTIVSGPAPAIAAGAVSGLMNTAAGIGGPAVSVYAVLSHWEQSRFAATLQPYFVTIAMASLSAKLAFSGGAIPDLDPWVWGALAVAMVVGLTTGDLLSRRISARTARQAVIVIAYFGGVTAIVHGTITALS